MARRHSTITISLRSLVTFFLGGALFIASGCIQQSTPSPEVQRLQSELQKMEKQQVELEEKVKKPPVGVPSSQLAEELELLRSRMERIREKLRAQNAPTK